MKASDFADAQKRFKEAQDLAHSMHCTVDIEHGVWSGCTSFVVRERVFPSTEVGKVVVSVEELELLYQVLSVAKCAVAIRERMATDTKGVCA